MNYVFFDVECANCLNGEGKICSFGYVLTDENFQVLKKKDILVDPNAPFLLGNAKTGNGIRLAYPLFKFKRAYTFPHYYHEIQKVLEGEDTLSFGFAVFQDVSYLSYSCKRYGLSMFSFPFFDIQKFEKELHHRKNVSGLDSLIEEYHLARFTYHRSDDDALMTMEVFRSLLETNNLTVKEVLKRYPDALNTSENYLVQEAERRKEKQARKLHYQKIRSLYEEPHFKGDVSSYITKYYRKNCFVDPSILDVDIEYLLKHKEKLEKTGMILTRNAAIADYVIIKEEGKRLHIPCIPATAVYITYQDFKKETLKKG